VAWWWRRRFVLPTDAGVDLLPSLPASRIGREPAIRLRAPALDGRWSTEAASGEALLGSFN
jgi:hypothetical protein